MFTKRKKLKAIWQEEEKLLADLITRKLKKQEYFSRLKNIQSKILKIGRFYDTLDELKEGLLKQKFIGIVHSEKIVEHEGQHAREAKKYGVTTKFVLVPTFMSVSVYAGHLNLEEEAKGWNLDDIENFEATEANIDNPSYLDIRYSTLKKQLNLQEI